jgi:trans-2,3-dihydro-3-hydroxyanthranilate isomerase
MTGTHQVQLVDAFTTEPMAGNPAGVVPDATDLSDDQMGAIAAELGASETAFVLPSDEADRRLRYFTPEREVDLCGHATVAAFRSLYDRAVVSADSYTVETNVGVLDVEIDPDGTVWLTQSSPEMALVDVDYDRVAAALGVETPALSEVGADLPLARVSTGFPFLLVPVSYFEQLSAIDPDMDAVADLCRAVDAEGLYAFTFDTLESDATLHGRAFVPLAGIPEDPVTGTASGAVAAYLRHRGALDQPDPIVCEQGHFLDRPGRVLVRTGESDDGSASDADAADADTADESATDGSDDDTDADRSSPASEAPTVGGQATVVLDGDLTVPAPDEDDIVEA